MPIAFVHNQALPYRHFLFQALAGRFDIDFFLFNQQPDEVPAACRARIFKGYHIPKGSDLWVVPRLGAALKRRRYSLIVGSDLGAYNTAVAYRVACRSGTPFIPWIEEWDWIRHPRRRMRKGFEHRLLSFATAVIAPGVKHVDYLLSRGVPREKIAHIPNAVDFAPRNSMPHHPLYAELQPIREKNILIVSVGRHVGFKGHDQTIRAQALVEQHHPGDAPFVVIAGNGPLLQKK